MSGHGAKTILTQGLNFNNLCRGLLQNASHLIKELMTNWFQARRFSPFAAMATRVRDMIKSCEQPSSLGEDA